MKQFLSMVMIIALMLTISSAAYAGAGRWEGAGTQKSNSTNTNSSPTPTAKPTPSPKSQYDEGMKPVSDYDWQLTVTGISTVKNDNIIKDTLSTDDTVYFSVELSGGKPGEKTKIHCVTTYPNGEKKTFVTEKEWECGWTGWFSSYNMNSGGVLLKEFYDDDGNLIGSGSVKITKSSSNSRSDSRLTESEAKSKAGEAVKKEIYGKYCFKYDSKKTSYSISSAEYKKFENAWIVKGTVTVYYLDGNGSTNGSFEVKIYDWNSGDFGINVSLDIT